jgi:hypothetical protein
LADEDSVDVLDVAGIQGFQHRPQAARLEVVADVEQGKPREAHAGQGEPARGFAARRPARFRANVKPK